MTEWLSSSVPLSEPSGDRLAMRAATASPGTTAGGSVRDGLALARQRLLRYEGQTGQRAFATVPVDAALAQRHGLQPMMGAKTHDGYLVVEATPWAPAWGNGRDPAEAAMREIDRAYHSTANVAADAFVAQATGLSAYRSAAQRVTMRAVMAAPPGGTLLAILPTGAGKSLCATLPGVLAPTGRVTVVVVPTVALALDQEGAANRQFGPGTALAYRSGKGSEMVDEMQSPDGTARIFYVSPEALVGRLREPVAALAARGALARFVVDEAHLVSGWGDEFRPEFQEIAGVRRALLRAAPTPFPTLLLSATVTEATRSLLETLFAGPGPFGVVYGARLRPEPAYYAVPCASEEEQTERVLDAIAHLPRPLVLYVTQPVQAQAWAARLLAEGYKRVGEMDGTTAADTRERLLAQWRARTLDIMVATSAFGMGVDQDDVRAVVHACVPESLDRYYQEVGRGGRDGTAAVSIVFHTPADVHEADGMAKQKVIKPDLGLVRWQAMWSARTPVPEVGGMEGDGRADIPLAASQNGVMHSVANERWNQRTLTLLARSGLIEPHGPGAAPGSRRVRPLDGHDDPVVWEARVNPERQRIYEAARVGRAAMDAALGGKECLSNCLSAYYRLGTRRPAHACGGCAACRSEAREGWSDIAGEPEWPWPASPTPDGLAVLASGASRVFVVGDLPNGLRARTLLEALVRRGVWQVSGALSGTEGWIEKTSLFTPGPWASDGSTAVRSPPVPTLVVHGNEGVPPSALLAGPAWRMHLVPTGADSLHGAPGQHLSTLHGDAGIAVISLHALHARLSDAAPSP